MENTLTDCDYQFTNAPPRRNEHRTPSSFSSAPTARWSSLGQPMPFPLSMRDSDSVCGDSDAFISAYQTSALPLRESVASNLVDQSATTVGSSRSTRVLSGFPAANDCGNDLVSSVDDGLRQMSVADAGTADYFSPKVDPVSPKHSSLHNALHSSAKPVDLAPLSVPERPVETATASFLSRPLPPSGRRQSIPAMFTGGNLSMPSRQELRRHASIGSRNFARDFLTRQDSMSSMQSASSIVSASSFASLPPSPAVSFLSFIAESTTQPVGNTRLIDGWEGELVGDYTIGKKIGVGNFAQVYDATVTNDMTNATHVVAVKIVHKRRPSSESPVSDCGGNITPPAVDLEARLAREINIWRQLKHTNIVRLFEVVSHTDDYCFMFSEYCKNGHLLDYMNQAGADGLAESIACYLFRQVADAICYLHDDAKVVHRDIKPENILLTTDFEGRLVAKLCDFGLSEYYVTCGDSMGSDTRPMSHPCAGSLAYCSPEELSPNLDDSDASRCWSPSPLSDIWSLGVVLYAMLSGQLPFADDYLPRLQMSIMAGKYKKLPTIETPLEMCGGGSGSAGGSIFSAGSIHHTPISSPSMSALSSTSGCMGAERSPRSSDRRMYSLEAADLVENMLMVDTTKRLSGRQVRQHAWLASTELDSAIGPP